MGSSAPSTMHDPSHALPAGESGAQQIPAQVEDENLDAMLDKMEGHLHRLKAKKGAVVGSPSASAGVHPTGTPGPPKPGDTVADSDLDAALSRMEGHLSNVKSHKAVANAMPHWGKENPPL